MRDPRRRRALEHRNSAYLEWLRDKASAFEDALTETQYRDVITAMRNDLRSCLGGDLSFLDKYETAEPRRAWWMRAVGRVGPAAVLAVAAVLLPFLPGVTASGTTLVGVQAGLAVAAVLTLVNMPSEAQKTIGDALKVTSSQGGK